MLDFDLILGFIEIGDDFFNNRAPDFGTPECPEIKYDFPFLILGGAVVAVSGLEPCTSRKKQ